MTPPRSLDSPVHGLACMPDRCARQATGRKAYDLSGLSPEGCSVPFGLSAAAPTPPARTWTARGPSAFGGWRTGGH